MFRPNPGIVAGHWRGRNVHDFGTDGRRGNCLGKLNRASERKTSMCHDVCGCEDIVVQSTIDIYRSGFDPRLAKNETDESQSGSIQLATGP